MLANGLLTDCIDEWKLHRTGRVSMKNSTGQLSAETWGVRNESSLEIMEKASSREINEVKK